jgi:hypothetical protein
VDIQERLESAESLHAGRSLGFAPSTIDASLEWLELGRITFASSRACRVALAPSEAGGAVAADHAQFLGQCERDGLRLAIQLAHFARAP